MRSKFSLFILNVIFLIVIGRGEVASAGERILLIGDSHSCGTYGDELSRLMRLDPSNSVTLYGSSGSTPDSWANQWVSPYGMRMIDSNGKSTSLDDKPTPLLRDLIRQNNPQRVVISLGTNFLWTPAHSEENWKSSIRKMILTIKSSGCECTWVGPPLLQRPLPDQPATVNERAQKLIRIRDILKQTVSQEGCTFIDGFSIAKYPDESGGDGIHFDLAGMEGKSRSMKWAKAVNDSVRRFQSSKPKSCDTPR